jgi:hypothetical protein
MKKAKLFLTVTTFCVAIAAVSATKANSRIAEPGFTQASSKCNVVSGVTCGSPGTGCKNGSGAQLFRLNNTQPCSIALQN